MTMKYSAYFWHSTVDRNSGQDIPWLIYCKYFYWKREENFPASLQGKSCVQKWTSASAHSVIRWKLYKIQCQFEWCPNFLSETTDITLTCKRNLLYLKCFTVSQGSVKGILLWINPCILGSLWYILLSEGKGCGVDKTLFYINQVPGINTVHSLTLCEPFLDSKGTLN